MNRIVTEEVEKVMTEINKGNVLEPHDIPADALRCFGNSSFDFYHRLSGSSSKRELCYADPGMYLCSCHFHSFLLNGFTPLLQLQLQHVFLPYPQAPRHPRTSCA